MAPLPASAALTASLLACGTLLATSPAASAQDEPRLITDRANARQPELTSEEDGFLFAVFGDRTGGPAEGIEVLADAVAEVNLIDPDLVMTVGDLINGYNQTPEWMAQMREYRATMEPLDCPWYPVAGNHDVYWRGEGRPPEEHEAHYEEHFGPLWYAVEHKGCWFLVLYTDEPNPETGERNFSKQECQRMSAEQLAWLESTLERTADARHVFVFVHHPRWTGGRYGNDWDKVHRLLADAGNVRAVFGGHIHHMRYDGPRDGIEYFTLATVGGHQSGTVPSAGWLHHYELVHVRDDGISVTSYPVGSATDPRSLTPEVVSETARVAGSLRLAVPAFPAWSHERGGAGDYVLRWKNPSTRPVELLAQIGSRDPRWGFFPDHVQQEVAPGETAEFTVRAMRGPGGLDAAFALPEATVQANWLGEGARFALPVRSQELPIELGRLPAPPLPAGEQVLTLDGRTGCVVVPSSQVDLPAGSDLTLECWYMPRDCSGRRGLVAKTESSEYGIFVSDFGVEWSVHVDGAYRTVKAPEGTLEQDRWHHLAGVWDGREVRLYVDGRLVGATPALGQRTTNALPLIVGADVDRAGNPTSHSAGRIDEVRLAASALYSGPRIELERRLTPDRDSILHLRMDGLVGPWLYDEGSRGVLCKPREGASLELISE